MKAVIYWLAVILCAFNAFAQELFVDFSDIPAGTTDSAINIGTIAKTNGNAVTFSWTGSAGKVSVENWNGSFGLLRPVTIAGQSYDLSAPTKILQVKADDDVTTQQQFRFEFAPSRKVSIGFLLVVSNFNGLGSYYNPAGISGGTPFTVLSLINDNPITVQAETNSNIGVSIPNINDVNSIWPANGAGPDIGAFEVFYVPTIVTNNASGARVSGFRNLGMSVLPRNLTTATDTFDRADEDPLATTMSDGVSTWSVGPGNWENLEIVSNEAVNANIAASSGAAAVATSPTFSANQSVSIVLGSTVGGQILIVRGDSLLEAGYAVGIDDSDTIVFSQLFSGSHMSLSTLSVVNGLSLSAGETVTLTVTGSGPVELKAYNDGVEIGSYTDSSGVVTGGQPGVAVWENSLDGGIASWSATDL